MPLSYKELGRTGKVESPGIRHAFPILKGSGWLRVEEEAGVLGVPGWRQAARGLRDRGEPADHQVPSRPHGLDAARQLPPRALPCANEIDQSIQATPIQDDTAAGQERGKHEAHPVIRQPRQFPRVQRDERPALTRREKLGGNRFDPRPQRRRSP